MRFEHPNLFWLLLVLPPALALFFWWSMRVRQKLLTQFVEARLLSQLTVGISPARRKMRFAFLILAAVFLVFTLARPQRGFDLEEVEQHGLDIVVAVDTSKSMLATDIAPNRLARAKMAALELMQRAGTDRLGLVAFAGNAFLECPLTIDNTAFQQSVQALDVNSIPQGGTAIAEAIDTALNTFKEINHFKVLVLMTDGEDNDKEPGALDAAKKAADAGLKIFTIGIGSKEGDLLNPDLVRDENGNAVKSHLNESLLQQIAGATGGFYLPLRGAETINTLYERGLEPLPKSTGKEKLLRRYHEQFQWPLAVAVLLLLAEMFLPERASQTTTQRKGNIAASATLFAILFVPVATNASPTSALRDYKAGNFTNSLAEYERLAQISTNDLRLVFNAGAAAYRATNYDEALKNFKLVTVAPDLKLQQLAYYNLGNVQFRAGAAAKDLDGLQEAWEMAIKSYERAVSLNTNDADAVFNLAFAKNGVEQIKAFREAMRRAKGEADAAVRQRNYHRALAIMEELVKNPVAKQFQDYTKKLKDIDAIATPHQP